MTISIITLAIAIFAGITALLFGADFIVQFVYWLVFLYDGGRETFDEYKEWMRNNTP